MIKVEIEQAPKERKLPMLVKSVNNGAIVMVTRIEHEKYFGLCLYPGVSRINKVGDCSDRWDSRIFEPFNGSVTISSD